MDTTTVCLDYAFNKALEGRYYIGHTPVLALTSTAWGALMNPPDSPMNLNVYVFTVTNFSATPFQAQGWLNAPLENAQQSPHVSPSNLAKKPIRSPHVRLLYAENSAKPSGGVSLLTRIAQPNTTVVAEYDGRIIVPPGSSFAVFLNTSAKQRINAELAFGWWEEYV